MAPASPAMLSNVTTATSHVPGSLPAGEPSWGIAGVNPADQASFENALEGTAVPIQPSLAIHSPSRSHVAATSSTSLGDSILNSLAGVKERGDVMQAEMVEALKKTELSSADLLRVQHRLMGYSIEVQATTNMAHHSVEDVKTIMRGQ